MGPNSKEDLQVQTMATRTPYIDLVPRPQHHCHHEKHHCNVQVNDRIFQKEDVDAVLPGQRERGSDTDSDSSRNEIRAAITTFGNEIGSAVATPHGQNSAAYIKPESKTPSTVVIQNR